MRTAEGVSKVQRVVSICEIQDSNSHGCFSPAAPVQRVGDCQVENCIRADTATVEIHELGTWTLHQVNEIIFCDLEGSAALVPRRKRC